MRNDWLTAGGIKQLGAVGEPDLKPIAKLGHRSDGRARGPDRIALLDGDGRTDVFGRVEGGRWEELEELPDVGAEGFDVAALALGMQSVEDERGFTGTAEARHDHQFPDGDIDIETL